MILLLGSTVNKSFDRLPSCSVGLSFNPAHVIDVGADGSYSIALAGLEVSVHTCCLFDSSAGVMMETCFVIQPFDAGRYDKLYRGVYASAIEAAGYKPYRVDKDPSVTVLIDSIESGIRSAIVCLADITEDNPNVWFELGYALASNRPVVMVCAENRQGRMFPFDIQHRPIILYKPESPSDFEVLKEAITAKIKAIVKKDEFLQKMSERMSESEPVTPVAGLSSPEIMLVALLAGGFTHNATISAWTLKEDAERAGITGVGINLAVRRLLAKQFIEEVTEYEPYNNNEPYTAYRLLDRAWDWIEANEDRIVMLRAGKADSDDSIPF